MNFILLKPTNKVFTYLHVALNCKVLESKMNLHAASTASDDDNDELFNEPPDEPFFKNLCVHLYMSQNATECTPEHVKLLKFTGRACSKTLLK